MNSLHVASVAKNVVLPPRFSKSLSVKKKYPGRTNNP